MTTFSPDTISAAVTDAMARYHVPGVAVGLIHGDQEWTAGFGVTSVEHPLPVDADTLFQIASITKTAVATAVMRLVEQGRIALDQPVHDVIPELEFRDPTTTSQLTIAHLLSHTGGFQGDVRDGAYGVHCGSGDDTLARFVALLAHQPQHALPGETWAYNNAGFCLAGRIVEVVTGQVFETAMRRLVLAPLGMDRSCFFAAEAITHRVAIGHSVRDGRAQVSRHWALPRVVNPAGGLICPTNELLRYARFHLGDGRTPGGERLLSPEAMALMRAPRVPDALHNGCLASFADEVGLSWFSRSTPRGRFYVHGGMTSLALRLTLVPSHQFAIFVLTNADMGAQLHAEVTKLAMRDYVGVANLDDVPLDVPTAELAQYAGTYRNPGPAPENAQNTVIHVADGRLSVGSLGPAALYAPDRVVLLEGLCRHERGQFLRGPDGAVTGLRLAGRISHRTDPDGATQ